MDEGLADVLWVVFVIAVIAATAKILRWRGELRSSGWWTGVVVEGVKLDVGVDHELCMGASSCVTLAPEIFRLDWSKKKSMFDPAPLETTGVESVDPERVFKAAQSCPYRAIFLQNAATGERVFP
jgi:ferredoxin